LARLRSQTRLVQDSKRKTGGSEYESEKLQIGLGKECMRPEEGFRIKGGIIKIMLKLKKGLALVLAAATVFTFAPVAGLGNQVTAEAANPNYGDNTVGDFTLSGVGAKATFDAPQFSYEDTASYRITVGDQSIIDVYSTNHNTTATSSAVNVDTDQRDSFTVVAKGVGKTTLTLTYTVNGAQKYSKTVNVTVNPESLWGSVKPNTLVSGFNGNGSKDNPYVVKVSATKDTFEFTGSNSTTYSSNTLKSVKSADPSVIDIADYTGTDIQKTVGNNTAAIATYKKSGTTTLHITYDAVNNSNGQTVHGESDIYVKVIANKSTLKVDSTEINTTALSSAVPVKTIALSQANPTATIGATLSDPQQSTEKVKYIGVYAYGTSEPAAVHSTEADYKNGDLKISDDKVTATATALSGVEKYYDIAISNNLGSTNEKVSVVRVIASKDGANFSTVTAQVNGGETWKAQAKYAAKGTVEDDNQTKAYTLSTKDRTSVPFIATVNGAAAGANVKSADTSIVSIENGQLVTHGKTGFTTVTVSASADPTHYGNASIDIRITVTDKYVDNKIEAEDLYLNKLNKTGKIKASINPDRPLTFRIVSLQSNNTYVTATDDNIDLNTSTGEVTYKTTAAGSALVEISAGTTNNADAPANAYVHVYYNYNKLATKLNVGTKSLNLNVGETGTVVASGSAVSFVSNAADVATVDAKTGVVTAVKAGVATITVTDAGDENYQGGSKDVTVYVYGASAKTYTDPAKVAGVKVSNKKGAKVSVSWTKDTTDQNIKYYVQKKIGKKTSGKSVGSNKTILSVKKGATVKVRVKAYYWDANGEKHVGKYSAWKTFKSDKK